MAVGPSPTLMMDCLRCEGRGVIETVHAATTPNGQSRHLRECPDCENTGKRPFEAPG
jgi:DnaJ-class molecular chaperone